MGGVVMTVVVMTVREVIQNFYESLERKTDAWQDNLSGDVVFADASRRLRAEGRHAFIQAFIPFLRAVENVQLKQLIVEDTDACAVVGYDYVSPTGAKLHQEDAEVWKIVNGQIVALTIYFDITEFRSFMGR
jgi:ketosteroid isomerase-like protein